MIALLLTAAFCGYLREAVAEAELPVAPFAGWMRERQTFSGPLELYKTTHEVPPFLSCRVAKAPDLSALECELAFDDAALALGKLRELTAEAAKCLGERWEEKHPPLEAKYGLLGVTAWNRRAIEVMLYAQGPSAKLHMGFPLEPVQKGAVLVLTVTVE